MPSNRKRGREEDDCEHRRGANVASAACAVQHAWASYEAALRDVCCATWFSVSVDKKSDIARKMRWNDAWYSVTANPLFGIDYIVEQLSLFLESRLSVAAHSARWLAGDANVLTFVTRVAECYKRMTRWVAATLGHLESFLRARALPSIKQLHEDVFQRAFIDPLQDKMANSFCKEANRRRAREAVNLNLLRTVSDLLGARFATFSVLYGGYATQYHLALAAKWLPFENPRDPTSTVLFVAALNDEDSLARSILPSSAALLCLAEVRQQLCEGLQALK
jgi:hypothetical protein